MNYKQLFLTIVFTTFSCIGLIYAQPDNDFCDTAIELTDVVSWCSDPGAYTNVDATPDGIGNPVCFAGESHDVWFSFTASANTVAITTIGQTNLNPGGTLIQPEIALYNGDCDGNLNYLNCQGDGFNSNVAEMIISNLIVGITYFIRVEGRNENTGTFQLCVNNYNAVPPPDGDCVTGVILCDKSPFTVQQLSGIGIDNEDLSGGCLTSESSSTWYKWTCDTTGSLAFTLTPNNPADDLDFVIYELPNGIFDCTDRMTLRCMASGENTGAPLEEWIDCTGATGLSETDPDLEEFPGCQEGNNNFASAIDMEEGKVYALIINNFSNSGNGFSIEFGGTGTFLGPTVDFEFDQDTICVGDSITFTDASFYVGGIADWQWVFGQDASPFSSSGVGPHTTSYDVPGTKSIVLSVQSEDGCIVTEIKTIEVICCVNPDDLTANITDVNCSNMPIGAIDLIANSEYLPLEFEWDNGEMTEDISGLSAGDYTVSVTDAASCVTVNTFTVNSSAAVEVELEVTAVSCNGAADGAIEAIVTGEEVSYLWSNEAETPNIDNLPAGTYTLTVTELIGGCTAEASATVIEPPALEIALSTTDVNCNGGADGTVSIVSEISLVTYLWSNEAETESIDNLPAGTYTVTVTDINDCTAEASGIVAEPLVLDVEVITTDVSCNGGEDGQIELIITGGTTSYTIIWEDSSSNIIRENLSAGTYAATITDARDCIAEISVSIGEPAVLSCSAVIASQISTLDGSDGAITANVLGGTAPYTFMWSNDSTGAEIDNLSAGVYTVTVIDSLGCTCETEIELANPSRIEGYVWEDENRDGLQDTDEIGIAGVEVTLVIANGDNIVTTTDADGNFVFDGIVEGDYSISVGGISGYAFTTLDAGDDSLDSDVDTDGSTTIFSVSSGELIDIDAGMYRAASVGNYVWFDDNCNGVQTIIEDGLEGIHINLIDANTDAVLASTVSDENGYYNFATSAGQYYIEFVVDSLPDYYQLTLQDQLNPAGGNSDVVDSDADFISGESPVFTLNDGQTINNIDAGICWLCDDITDPGSIGYDQTICAGEVPDTLVNVEFPSGGSSSSLQYMWMYEVEGGDLQMIPGTNMPYYLPSALDETTYFRRCARREGCPWFLNESDEVVVEVEDCEMQIIIDRPNLIPLYTIEDIRLYPNPVKTLTKLKTPPNIEDLHIQIYSIQGILLQEIDVTGVVEEYEVDVTAYPKGVYNIKIDYSTVEKRKTEVLRFIKI